MANYTGVTWQPDDEVTSTKLQQMCTNQDWLKENLILGDVYFVANNSGALLPTPFTVGSTKLLKIDAKVKPFNSQVETAWIDMDINIPPGYTNVPLCIPTVTDVHSRGYYVNLKRYNGLTSVTVRITQADHIAKVISGQVQCLFIGW